MLAQAVALLDDIDEYCISSSLRRFPETPAMGATFAMDCESFARELLSSSMPDESLFRAMSRFVDAPSHRRVRCGGRRRTTTKRDDDARFVVEFHHRIRGRARRPSQGRVRARKHRYSPPSGPS